MQQYYTINEDAARRAKDMNSFSDYKPVSATAEYRKCVDKAVEIAERQKKRVDLDTGRHRNTFATFRCVTEGRDGIWQYCGHCFQGENMERGTKPPYVRLWK